VVALAGNDPRIHLYPGFIADEAMQTYLLASDAVVVPYREILTSGTAMLALSFGRPVVSVALGFLKDVVGAEVGVLYPPADPAGLAGAMRAAMDRRFDEAVILEHARRYTFDHAAALLVDALRTATT
jgi:glycosyltransferase involved in cell wall biosynthesis